MKNRRETKSVQKTLTSMFRATTNAIQNDKSNNNNNVDSLPTKVETQCKIT